MGNVVTDALQDTATDARLPELLAGNVATITGTSRGTGAARAQAFAGAGARVVLAARGATALTSVAREIGKAGGDALAVPMDAGDPSAVERPVPAAVEACGPLDAAFNDTAGGGRLTAPLADVDAGDFDSAFRVNLRGVDLCLEHEIPVMIACGGAIVDMSSTAGLRGVPGVIAYSASKHGIIGLTPERRAGLRATRCPRQRGRAGVNPQ